MSNWVKNAVTLAVGLGIAAIFFAFAWQFFGGSDGTVKITNGEIEVKLNPKAQIVSNEGLSIQPKSEGATAPSSIAKKVCRLPEHGFESWGKTQAWTADSDWRKGGSSPSEFCAAQKVNRERQFPDRTSALLNTSETHKSEYTPFKHDFYRYTCSFEDRWEPIYKLAENPRC